MDRRSLESTATSYPSLRGLAAIPIGAVFVLLWPTNEEWGPVSQRYIWIAILVAALAFLRINRYYDETFGRVTLPRRVKVRTSVVSLGGAAVLLGGAALEWSFDLPLNCTAASFAIAMLAIYAVNVGLSAHHVIIWGSILVASLLPVWGGVGADAKFGGAFLLMGVATTMAAGVLDHRALTQTFGRAAGLDLENGNARA